MTTYRMHTVACDDAACAELHAATLEVLDKTGVEVLNEGALDLLRTAGARVEGTRVRLPATLVNEAIEAAPKSIAVTSRPGNPERAGATPLDLRAGATYYGTGSDSLYLLGPDTHGRRPVKLADVERFAALQEQLPNIDFVMSMAHPGELPPSVADAAQFAAMLRGTSKPLLMVTAEARGLPAMKEMAAACGAADSWAIYAMPTPPLTHGKNSADLLMTCARLGVPVAYATALLQGATAPASRAGFVVLGNAEMLSGLVITQLTAPGAPYVYGVAQGAMNLRTSHVLYCAPESYAIQQASVDLATHYGLPSFGYGGCSDSPLLDEQWALEAGMTLLAQALSGVTLLHDLGYVASGTASSFESVVLMDEAVAWVKAYLAGITIDTEMLAVEEIDAAGPGGTHLSRKFTRRHHRDWFTPSLLSQQSHESWAAAGGSTLLERTARKTGELLDGEPGYRLASDVLEELDRLVEDVRRLREGA
jgi:trimethylamine--corrinoid protein Co-methyltransferase